MHAMSNKQQAHPERGIALLITLLVMTVLLGISASLINITIKQFQFASIGYASESAFQAANAGMECALYHDYEAYPASKFDVGQNATNIQCFGVTDSSSVSGVIASGDEQRYQFSWKIGDGPEMCTEISVYKILGPLDITNILRASTNQTCAAGANCTVIQSRGYNVPCPAPGNTFPPRTIERELTQRY